MDDTYKNLSSIFKLKYFYKNQYMPNHTSESIQQIATNFINNKNNKTFSVLINRLKPGLSSFVYRYIKDKDIINEIVSQTFISIWEKIDQYKFSFNFSTWAYAIAKNEALGQLRVMNKTVSRDKLLENNSSSFKELVTSEDSSIHNFEIGGDHIERLYDISMNEIYNLKEPYKTVMIEREVNKKQLQLIADDLGWNTSTVKTRLRKARKDVAKNILNNHPELVELYKEQV